jgi:hypothetical protein
VDRCCQDLDGGGVADDGVLIESVQGQQVNRVVLYEDTDKLGHWSPTSPIRYDRRGAPTYRVEHPAGDLLIREFCCDDYDGGTRNDDGILVVMSRPNDVLMATLFERTTTRKHAQLR